MAKFSQDQVNNAAVILRVGQQVGATAKQIQAAFLAAWVESRFRNLNYGDRDSLGLFQQRPSQGWGTAAQVTNPEYAARKFYETAKRVSQSGTAGQLAQRVQRSGFPLRYDQQAADPLELLARLSGGGGAVVGNQSLTTAEDAENVKYLVYALAAVMGFLILKR